MPKRITPPALRARKGGEKIVCLTAYSAPMAKLLDPHVDMLLVGDSLGMVVYGMADTMGVNLAMMCNHGKAVVDASSQACVVVDMPFGSYEPSKVVAFRSAARIMKATGCQAVKLEGGEAMAETIAHLTQGGIAVVAHIGLLPQSVRADGGYKYRGKTDEDAKQLLDDAKAVADAGACAVVMECVDDAVANDITAQINIPTIGIGAGNGCDGQVLVSEDLFGLTGQKAPGFVTPYAQLHEQISSAAADFAAKVRG